MSTILIVDDGNLDRQVLGAILRSKGYTVLEASCASEALEQLREHHPALIIVDILMPGINGLELVAHIQADPELASTLVLFYTAWYDDARTAQAMRALGYAVLAKPITPREAVRHVQAVLGDA